MFLIDKYLEVSLYCAIFSFGLATYFKMERGKEFLLNANKVIKQKPGYWNNQRASIAYDKL